MIRFLLPFFLISVILFVAFEIMPIREREDVLLAIRRWVRITAAVFTALLVLVFVVSFHFNI